MLHASVSEIKALKEASMIIEVLTVLLSAKANATNASLNFPLLDWAFSKLPALALTVLVISIVAVAMSRRESREGLPVGTRTARWPSSHGSGLRGASRSKCQDARWSQCKTTQWHTYIEAEVSE